MGTTLPITQVAFAAGFSSIRRFNAAFRAHQKMTPSDVRRPRSTAARAADEGPRIVLDVRPPFDPAPAFAFLKARAVTGAEVVTANAYHRATAIGGRKGIVSVSPAANRTALVVQVSSSLGPSLMMIAARVRRMFDTDADPRIIGAELARDPALERRVKARPALRVMGAFDPFDWASRAVLGQQVSVRAALTIAGRLVERFGTTLDTGDVGRPDRPTRVWPDAARLAGTTEDALAALGLTRARARTLHHLAMVVADGSLVLDRTVDPEAMREQLLALPGVGPWTADYIAMRALGWPDAFPAGDLGLRKALGGITAAECERRSSAWRPWRAYAAAHLWLGSSEETGP
jgi:AraC family transcriptional regulator of adaptative response / DNA-3-methyladenine glycosylase II